MSAEAGGRILHNLMLFGRLLRGLGLDVSPGRMRDLAAATPDLTESFEVVNRLLNTVAYNPPGAQSEGFLFWQSWVNHAGNAIFSTADAHGPIRRGLVVLSCSTAQLLDSVAQANPQLGTLVALLNAPSPAQICPTAGG